MKKIIIIMALAGIWNGLSSCTNHEVNKDFELITPADSTQGKPAEKELHIGDRD